MVEFCNKKIIKMEVYCDKVFMYSIKNKLSSYKEISVSEKRHELVKKRNANKNS